MSEAAVPRLFLGVDLDSGTRPVVAAHLHAHLADEMPGRAVPPQNWHVTLRFLGAARPHQAERIVHHLSEHHPGGAFSLRFGALGAFPRPSRAAVLWLGIDRGGEELAAVAASCEEAALAAGFDAEDRPFHPHLTLSRIRPPVDASALIAGVPPLQAPMEVGEITLFESHLGRGGARYEVLEQIAL